MQTAQRLNLVEPLTAVGLFEMVNFAWSTPFLSGLYLPDDSVPDSSVKDRTCVLQPVPQTRRRLMWDDIQGASLVCTTTLLTGK